MKKKDSAPKIVFDWLVNYIHENQLKNGDMLPKELDISKKLQVSRASVREAIVLLKAFGIVESRTSIGLILIADPRQLDLISLFLHNKVDGSTFREIKQLRDFIELGSAHLMIRNVTTSDLKILNNLIEQVCPESGPQISPLEFEVNFHEHLAILSGNNFAIALSLIYKPLFQHHVKNHPLLKDNHIMPDYIIENHRKIIKALEDRNFEQLLIELREQARHTE